MIVFVIKLEKVIIKLEWLRKMAAKMKFESGKSMFMCRFVDEWVDIKAVLRIAFFKWSIEKCD